MNIVYEYEKQKAKEEYTFREYLDNYTNGLEIYQDTLNYEKDYEDFIELMINSRGA